MGLQLSEEFFEECFVKNSALPDGPHLMDAAFGGQRKTCQNHGAVVILRAFSYRNSIGNGVRLVIVGSDGIKFYVEIALVSIFFTGAIPACLDLHAVGNVAGL